MSRSASVSEGGCLLSDHTDIILHELRIDNERLASLRAEDVIGGALTLV